MARRITVEVEWDDEAGVWIAACPEIGLFTEAASLDALRARVPRIAADLLDGDPAAGEVEVELLVRLDSTLAAA